MAMRILCAAIAAMLLAAMPAHAQLDRFWRVCNNPNALPDAVIKNCSSIINATKATLDLARAFNNRGLAWHAKRNYDRAIADYNSAIKLNPKFAIAYSNRGNSRLSKGEVDRAIADQSEAIRVDPKHAGAYTNRCWARATVGRELELALADCNTALQLGRADAGTLDSRGFVYLRLGRLDEAIADYDAALKADPRHASSLYGRGIAKLRKGDDAGGKADIAAATAIRADVAAEFARYGVTPPDAGTPPTKPPVKPPDSVPPADSAELLRICGSNAPADDRMKACTAILEFKQQSAQDRAIAYNHRGSIHQASGDIDSAISDFTEAIKLNPKFVEAYINRGTAWDDKGDLDQAIADFTTALKLDPKQAPAHYLRGDALLRNGELDRAIDDFTEAIRLDRNYARAYLNRGLARLAKGEYIHAAADFSDVIRLDPKDAAAFYNRGRARLYGGSATQALMDLQQAGELDSANAYHALWIEIASRRANAPSQLRQALATIDKNHWPAPVVLMFLGQTTPIAVLTAAIDGKAARQKEQVCEANFFIGHWALRQGNKKEAVRLFRVAASECPSGVAEGSAARAELQLIGETP